LEQEYSSANFSAFSGIQNLGQELGSTNVTELNNSDYGSPSAGSFVSSDSVSTPESTFGIDPSITIVNECIFQIPIIGDELPDTLPSIDFIAECEQLDTSYSSLPSRVAIPRATPSRCPHCQSGHPDSQSLGRHLESSHRLTTCDFDGCVSTFRTIRDAKRHKNSVHSARRFRSMCGSRFRRRDGLLRHNRACPSCSKVPAHNTNLNYEEDEEETC